jgi:hypothetical protein
MKHKNSATVAHLAFEAVMCIGADNQLQCALQFEAGTRVRTQVYELDGCALQITWR